MSIQLLKTLGFDQQILKNLEKDLGVHTPSTLPSLGLLYEFPCYEVNFVSFMGDLRANNCTFLNLIIFTDHMNRITKTHLNHFETSECTTNLRM